MINLKNKKVTVMGLGLYEEGSGISAVRFLLSQGAKVTVTDLKSREQLSAQIKRLGAAAKKIKFVLGGHRDADFVKADLVIKNPDVRSTSSYLKLAQQNNIPVETDISLFFQLVDRKRIIGITGTRGKSTTTTLIYEFLKAAGWPAIIGGNIKRSPLTQLADLKSDGLAVLELSSWMLESLEPIKKSPHVAVFTNIYPDHLNTYAGMKEYIAAKKNIFAWQNLQDFVVLNRDNPETKKMGQEVPSQRFWTSLKKFPAENGCFVSAGKIIFRRDGVEQNICSVKEIKLPGQHNLANALAAICVAAIYGIKSAMIRQTLQSFRGVPDRLELLRELRGIAYYNDTTSTTPEATMAALQALSSGKAIKRHPRLILIAGGSDKGLDFKAMLKEVEKTCKAVILLKGTGTDRIKKEIKDYKLKIKNLTIAESMADAVGIAGSFATKSDIILLSPACASFGMFRNEFDRGNQFKSIVASLK